MLFGTAQQELRAQGVRIMMKKKRIQKLSMFKSISTGGSNENDHVHNWPYLPHCVRVVVCPEVPKTVEQLLVVL